MKEITAIVRPRKMEQTKNALAALGFPCMTAIPVIGRGRQRGIAGELAYELPPRLAGQGKSGGMKYIPKRMLTVFVGDADAEVVVQTIIAINQTDQIGDGKIFVSPVEGALRIRTHETDEAALA